MPLAAIVGKGGGGESESLQVERQSGRQPPVDPRHALGQGEDVVDDGVADVAVEVAT